MIRIFFIILFLSLPAFAFQNETQLANPRQEAKAVSIFKNIRCIVCRGESLAESNAELAVNMRALIREKVAAGQDGDEIKQYLVMRYGDVILQKPAFEEKTYALWLMPLVLLLGGVIVIRRILSRKYGSSRTG